MSVFVAFVLAILNAMLMDNVVLSRFYGICSFIGVGNRVKSATSMGLAVTFVIVLATIVCWPIYTFLLVPAGIAYFDTVIYILVIASLVQAVALFVRRFSPSLYRGLGIYLPLITSNCAVLGVVQSNTDTGLDFLSSLANGVGTSLGYFLVIFLFACIREKFEGTNMPKAMKGVPIALVTAALLALSFYGLQGII